MRGPINFLIAYLKEIVYLKGIGAEKRTILKWILEKESASVWTGCSWFRILKAL
jgi:hypothetical protein